MTSLQTNGAFVRPPSAFRNFISKEPNAQFAPEKGRYALYLSPNCPWAHRTIIVRKLKHLEDIIDLYLIGAWGEEGWAFNGANGTHPEDPLHGFKTIKELYLHVDPSHTGRSTVPVLWDKKTDTIVNNESSEIIRMFYDNFDEFLPEEYREVNKPGGGLYPENLRKEIDEINEWVYATVNNGVYRTGFASTQEAYEAGLYPLFESLDRLEALLGHGKPFLFGGHVTEADVRLYTTLARFDVAYVPVFLCNLKTIRHDYPRLHLWLRRLYWDKGPLTSGAFYDTTSPWIHTYGPGYTSVRQVFVTPTAPFIVPKGPKVLIEELKESEKL
ncbi:glutathione S-transferase [Bisporella sp. PMI_857]|nr:glutathione S-transferase [Bisporella sp. PMI_857]